ncbi:MAG: thiamine-phosphate kinase [Rhodocyclaceae bacterium]
MPSEFDLIRRHFTRDTRHTELAGGDDAALMSLWPGCQLVVSTDMLVAGTHFFADTDPRDIGWKTLAVNLSDIAAMAAAPRWAVLALALPEADERWVAAFADGLFACADAFEVDLVGGDTTRGPLNLCVTLFGEVPIGEAVTRSGANVGDDLWVTGTPGLAALGLAHLRGELTLADAAREACLAALHRPTPRVEAGKALRGIASAMLDVSDGLLGDLTHILERSQVGADVQLADLPLERAAALGVPPARAREALLHGGDDYELLFTAPPSQRDTIGHLSQSLGLTISRIGHITDAAGQLALVDANGQRTHPQRLGYDHFS